jgi:hypothetical protein
VAIPGTEHPEIEVWLRHRRSQFDAAHVSLERFREAEVAAQRRSASRVTSTCITGEHLALHSGCAIPAAILASALPSSSASRAVASSCALIVDCSLLN